MSKFQPIQDFNGLSPQTTKGDIVSRDTSGAVRVAVGADGLVLTASSASSSGVAWSASAPVYNYTSQTTTYNAVISDYIICSSASFTVTLPTAASQAGKSIIIKHNGSSLSQVYTVNTTSAQTMIGPAGAIASGALALYTAGEIFVFTSDGTNWHTNHTSDIGWIVAGTAYMSATSAYVFTWTGNKQVNVGDVYTDGTNSFTVTTTSNTTTGTFSGLGPGNPAAASPPNLTLVTGTGIGSITYNSRTITGQPVKGSGTEVLEWSRRGRFMKVHWYGNLAAGSAAGSGDALITIMPPGATIDLTGTLASYNLLPGTLLLTNTAAAVSMVQPSGQLMASGVAITTPTFFVYSPTQVRLAGLSNVSAFGNVGGSFFAITNAQAFSLTAEFPITGWQP